MSLNKWQEVILWVVGLIALVVAIYAGTMDYPFVFDDSNVVLRRTPKIYAKMDFWKDVFRQQRGLSYYTYGLNHRWGELEPFGYRVVNLSLHVLTSLIVVALVYSAAKWQKLKHAAWASWISGFIFAVHPIQTEAAIYSAVRSSVLATLLVMLGVLAYIRWRMRMKQWWWLAMGAVAMYLGIYAKETAYVAPLLILVVEIVFFAGDWLRKGGVKKWIVTGGLGLFALGATFYFVSSEVAYGDSKNPVEYFNRLFPEEIYRDRYKRDMLGRKEFLLTQQVVRSRYVGMILWPAGQSVDHDVRAVTSYSDVYFLLSLALLVGMLGAVAWLARNDKKLASVGILFFLIGLLPTSSLYILPIAMVEYRLYSPMVGVALIVAEILVWLRKRAGDQAAIGTVLAVIAILSLVSYERVKVWESPLKLWADVMEKYPDKPRAYTNTGTHLVWAGRGREARELLLEAKDKFPDNPLVLQNLAGAYQVERSYEDAKYYLHKSLELWEENPGVYYSLGGIHYDLKEWGESTKYYELALEKGGEIEKINPYLASIKAQQGDYVTARRLLDEVFEIDPNHALANQLLRGITNLDK